MLKHSSKTRFGPAGNGERFYNEGHKDTLEVCGWLRKMGLSAYEYQATRGVKGSPEFFLALGQKALEADIALSIHAPYYISMANPDSVIREKSLGYIMEALQAARLMGAKRVVIHLGGTCKQERKTALNNVKKLMETVLELALSDNLLADTLLCPETMGKPGQIGSLEEVLDICTMHQALRPTLDLAHLHAVSQGGLKDKAAFMAVFERMEAVLGREALLYPHIHFSPIEYGKGGELRHRSCQEQNYGPDFSLLAQTILELDIAPTIICESAGTQAEDAASLQDYWQKLTHSQG